MWLHLDAVVYYEVDCFVCVVITGCVCVCDVGGYILKLVLVRINSSTALLMMSCWYYLYKVCGFVSVSR